MERAKEPSSVMFAAALAQRRASSVAWLLAPGDPPSYTYESALTKCPIAPNTYGIQLSQNLQSLNHKQEWQLEGACRSREEESFQGLPESQRPPDPCPCHTRGPWRHWD